MSSDQSERMLQLKETVSPTSELTVCPSFTLFLILSSISCLRAASCSTQETPDLNDSSKRGQTVCVLPIQMSG